MASLGNLCLGCVVTLTVKVFPDVQMTPPLFHFMPVASCPVTVTQHHCKGPGSAFFTPKLEHLVFLGSLPYKRLRLAG